MHATPAFQRTPLVITAGDLVAGPLHATFHDGDRESLLHSYLVLIRTLRGQQREPTITLRGEDIAALAQHLGTSDERVLDDLLDRMGATRAQRKALAAMFAAGVLAIVATGSIAIDLAPADARGHGTTDPPAARSVVEVPDRPSGAGGLSDPPATRMPSPADVAAGDVWPSVDWEYTVSLHQLTSALAEEPLVPAEPLGAHAAEGVGVADDGSVVGVGLPPVPPGEGVGVADDGSVVGVGLPPVPPGEGIGVADDGSVVGVGLPPVP